MQSMPSAETQSSSTAVSSWALPTLTFLFFIGVLLIV